MPNNDYCRRLEITGFRNIGARGMTFLTVNRSLSRDKLGGLVVLIGQNNSGKSNVLDAVKKSVTGDFADVDRCDLPGSAEMTVRMAVIHGEERTYVPKRSETNIEQIRHAIQRKILNPQEQTKIDDRFERTCSEFGERYGFRMRPEVLEYREDRLRSRDLTCGP